MKRILILTMFLLMTGVNLYAGNGDLIVNGNVGVGTATVPSCMSTVICR